MTSYLITFAAVRPARTRLSQFDTTPGTDDEKDQVPQKATPDGTVEVPPDGQALDPPGLPVTTT